MKELLDKAYRDLDTYKIPVENRMNKKRLDCNDYNDFLKYNRNDPSDFEIDYDRNNEECVNVSCCFLSTCNQGIQRRAI